MELKVKIQLSPKQTVEAKFNAPSISEVLLEAAPFLAFDGICGFCKGEEFTLQTRLAGEQKEFKYTEFICNNCRAKRQVGEYKGNKGFFLRGWEAHYNKEDNQNSTA